MLKKLLVFTLCIFVCGYCFAEDNNPVQVVTSELFEQKNQSVVKSDNLVTTAVSEIPAWPLAGSDVDVLVECGTKECQASPVKPTSKIENTERNEIDDNMWSGGANILHGTIVPAGFDDECYNDAEMPLLHREMLEDDGGSVLAVSRSANKKCSNNSGGYAVYTSVFESDQNIVNNDVDVEYVKDATKLANFIDVNMANNEKNVVKSWVVASGQTLRDVLQEWCDTEGWDLAWNTSREYPIEAGAVFKGRFVDVASALVRNFGRANPVPYAKFFKGNRVLVISTKDE